MGKVCSMKKNISAGDQVKYLDFDNNWKIGHVTKIYPNNMIAVKMIDGTIYGFHSSALKTIDGSK